MNRASRRIRAALSGCCALVAAAMSLPGMGAIYVAESDEVPRYASHPTDSSFRLLIRDETPPPALKPPVAATHPAVLKRRSQLDPLIDRVARRQQVEPALVRAVIEVESQFHAQALSPKGALGAMQLMPQTARRYGVSDRRDPAQNIEGGVAYLRDLLGRFQGNVALALAAYNAGEHAVDRQGQVIPRYRETMLYVPRVLEAYMRYRASDGSPR
jgi:soluble lytic murein transglycosylase-like protein